MPHLTIAIGAGLIIVGFAGYFGTGRASFTALIPAGFGLVLLVLGLVARSERLRKHMMHAAVIVAVLGLAGSARGVPALLRWLGGTNPERPMAVVAQIVMLLLCAIYVVFAVRSFIRARGAGQAS